MLTELIKMGGYAMMLKAVADRYAMINNKSRIARKRRNAKNMLLGAGIGTMAGVAAGLLFAPKAGRETRQQIAQRTGESLTKIREGVSNTTERISARIQDKKSSVQEAAEICSNAIRDATKEPVMAGKKRKKR
jgi:gas vesicle protein